MTKMEEDPLIPQRMRDIARTQMCDEFASAYNLCGKDQVRKIMHGFFFHMNETYDMMLYILGYESCCKLPERIRRINRVFRKMVL